MCFLISNFVDDVKSHCQKVGCNLNSVLFFFKALLFRYEHMYVWKCARMCRLQMPKVSRRWQPRAEVTRSSELLHLGAANQTHVLCQ